MSKYSYDRLVKKFHVSSRTIRYILDGKIWITGGGVY